MRTAGYETYRRIQTETSSPAELILLLYDALLNDLEQAHDGLARRDFEAAHRPLLRAQDIVLELISSLDLEAGDIARQLAPLYEYQYQRLLEASVQKDATAVAEVARLITPLRNAWAHAVLTVQAGRA